VSSLVLWLPICGSEGQVCVLAVCKPMSLYGTLKFVVK
jgi:hypothetical protein